MWFSDLFKKDATVLNYSYTNGEKVLCRLHDRLSEGALTINDIIKEIHLPYPQSTFRGLCEAGYVRHWTYHGHPSDPLNMSFLITKKGEHKAEELKGIKGSDGLPIFGDH